MRARAGAGHGPRPTRSTIDDPDIYIELAHPTRRIDPPAIERLARYVLAAEGRACHSLGFILTDHATVLELNRTYLGHDYPTDVLSFNLDATEGAVEGEVYIDLDTAAERHEEFGASFEEEVHRYAVHGLLHLLGYEDDTPDARAAMQALEDRYLAATRRPLPGRA